MGVLGVFRSFVISVFLEFVSYFIRYSFREVCMYVFFRVCLTVLVRHVLMYVFLTLVG